MDNVSPRGCRQRGLSLPTTLLLLGVLLLSFGLRLYRLGDKSVWWDEGLAAWAARQSLVDIARWTSADVHPPLYFFMLHFWRLGSGDSEFGLRYLSASIGVLTVAATYLLGRLIAGPTVGIVGAFFLALSRFDVWWSQEMRMYALAALLASLSLWGAIRTWERGTLSDAARYVLFGVAGLYTLYLQVSVLLVVNLVWLWDHLRTYGLGRRADKDRRARNGWGALARWVGLQCAILLLFAPWLAYAIGRIPTWSSASPVKPATFFHIYWTMLTLGIPIAVERYTWLTLPLLAFFLAGLVALLWTAQQQWRWGRDVGLLLLSTSLPAGVVFLVSLPREAFFYSPQLAPRYLILFAPAFYVLLAWGLIHLTRHQAWAVRASLVALFGGVALYGLWTYYPERMLVDDYPSLVATVRAYQRPSDAVVLYTDKDWPVFAYHYPGQWWKIPHALQVTPEAADAYLSPIWEEHAGIWLVVTPYAGVNDPAGEVPLWLAGRSQEVVEYRFADKVLRFYARTEERARTAQALGPDARPDYPLSIALGDARLVGYEHAVDEYRNGDEIHLFLYAEGPQAGEGVSSHYEVSIEPVGAVPWRTQLKGTLQQLGRLGAAPIVLASDLPPGQMVVRQQVDLIVPPDAPEGRYAFRVRPVDGAASQRFGDVWVRSAQQAALTTADVTVTHPMTVDFDDGIRLLGYDLGAGPVEPGGTVDLTLYWQARRPVERRFKVFTHVLGEVFNAARGGFLWGQQDNEPVSDTRPTSTWRLGEVIVDRYAILLDPQTPAGRYALEVGLYDPATLERLPVLDENGQAIADHVVLAPLQVRHP